ncbi:hypothetical protein [Psychrobacter sp. WY6]|uniref:hypothetical protein n=1 Tax=Psychrobacter sp. WY6 TaxID=2708350 RepID=UPI002022BAE4|nr:hypothetical protein [Psychrobacter sp. WY6]
MTLSTLLISTPQKNLAAVLFLTVFLTACGGGGGGSDSSSNNNVPSPNPLLSSQTIIQVTIQAIMLATNLIALLLLMR